MTKPDWNARAARASDLIPKVPAAAELLRFYCNLAEFEGQVYAQVSKQASADPERPIRGQIDPGLLLPFVPELLRITEAHGPARLAEAARALRAAGTAKWQEAQMDYVAGLEEEEDPLNLFFARACVEPYAEHLATQIAVRHPQVAGTCPVCTGKPMQAVLRPEGEGARRSLVCAFCLTEWDFRRLLCPACGEDKELDLPVFTPEGLPYIRVEACDICHHYLLCVDLSKNGLAVPLVDQIAAAPLDLWAAEKGYSKIAAHLLGL